MKKLLPTFVVQLFLPMTLILVVPLHSCEGDPEASGEVQIHLLLDFEALADHACSIDESTVQYRADPFISYDDLLYYDREEYEFGLSQAGIDSVGSMEHTVNGTPVAVVANGELVYTAYFWPMYSSMGCDWTVMDPIGAGFRGILSIRQGYPGEFPDSELEDRRNDLRILRIFERDGKLRP